MKTTAISTIVKRGRNQTQSSSYSEPKKLKPKREGRKEILAQPSTSSPNSVLVPLMLTEYLQNPNLTLLTIYSQNKTLIPDLEDCNFGYENRQ